MPSFTEKQIEAMSESMRLEHGASQDEIKYVLNRTLTVGALKKALQNIDDSLPVEVEVVLEITDDGHCTTQPGLAIHSYQVTEGDDGFPRFALVGVQPQNAEAYVETFELEPVRQ